MWFNLRDMQKSIQTVALIGKYQSPEVTETILHVASYLRERGLTVRIEEGTASSTGMALDHPVCSYEQIGEGADLAIVVGGDGTMLNAARRLARFDVPLVGINQGRLGFLTDITRSDAEHGLDAILRGDAVEESRFMLDVAVLREGVPAFNAVALNDVVVNKGDLGRMIEFDVAIDGEFVYTQRSDGMIVSTPTGSTAYALSANGPILHPSVDGIALVPLCPHTLTARPVTLPDSCRIDITLLAPHDASVHFDGQERFDARAGDCIRVTRAADRIRLLHPPGYSYFAMLREKLHWSASPRYP
jgi:NAD+ kinase